MKNQDHKILEVSGSSRPWDHERSWGTDASPLFLQEIYINKRHHKFTTNSRYRPLISTSKIDPLPVVASLSLIVESVPLVFTGEPVSGLTHVPSFVVDVWQTLLVAEAPFLDARAGFPAAPAVARPFALLLRFLSVFLFLFFLTLFALFFSTFF